MVAPQTEQCSRCLKEKHWIDIYEINYDNVCIDCMTEKEKELNNA